MPTPVATRAVYADYRRIKTRKVHQIVFEIPSELWPEAYAFLGEPNIENSDWYGIARLRPELIYSDEPELEEDITNEALKWALNKWVPNSPQNPAVLCAFRCKEDSFWRFLREKQKTICDNEADAATYVRRFCNINTRADLATNERALQRWQFLASAYEAWLPKAA